MKIVLCIALLAVSFPGRTQSMAERMATLFDYRKHPADIVVLLAAKGFKKVVEKEDRILMKNGNENFEIFKKDSVADILCIETTDRDSFAEWTAPMGKMYGDHRSNLKGVRISRYVCFADIQNGKYCLWISMAP